MASNVFSPGAGNGSGAAPSAQGNPKASVENIARQTGVPVNVLFALGEAAGVQTGDDLVKIASDAGGRIGQRVAAGETLDTVLNDFTGGPESTSAFIQRARALGAEMYPELAAKAQQDQPGLVGNVGRQIVGGFVSGVGAVAEGAGTLADVAVRGGKGGDPTALRAGGAAVGDWIQSGADNIRAGVSGRAKQAIADSTPGGNILDPTSWTLGSNPSLEGYLYLGSDVLGSFLPVVAAAVMTGGAGAATVGGAQGAGSASQTASDTIRAAAAEMMPDGRSRLEHESAYFRELLGAGISAEEALAKTEQAAAQVSAMMTAPVSAFGGAATQKILSRGFEHGVGGPMRRALTTGLVSGIEEGAQEAVEGIATRLGIEAGSGLQQNVMDGTFGDFVLGALGGGPAGAAGGAIGGVRDRARVEGGGNEPPEQGAGQERLALPSPTGGGTVFAPGPVDVPRDPTVFERAPGEARPRPMREAARKAPAPALPDAVGMDMTAGTAVAISSPDMGDITGRLTGETPLGVTITTDEGEVLEIPRGEIESGAVSIMPVEMIGQPDAAAPSIVDADTRSEEPLAALRPKASAAPGPSPAPTTDAPANPRLPDDPGALRKRLAFLNEQGRTNGWNPRLSKMRDDVEAKLRLVAPEDFSAPVEIIAKRDGSAFPSAEHAARAITNRRLDPAAFDIIARDGGFIAIPQAQKEQVSDGRAEDIAAASDVPDGAGSPEVAADDRGADAGRGEGSEAVPEEGRRDGGIEQPVVDRPAESLDGAVAAGELPRSLKIEPIRERAAILRGWDSAEPPAVDGVGLKFDKQADGWVFSRKHEEKVRAALIPAQAPDKASGETSERAAQIEVAAAEAHPEPTEGQKEAGNYKMGHVRVHGLDISIENAKGSTRSGRAPDGAEWSVEMPAHYGYVRGTEGADGDHVDVYIGENPDSDRAFIIDQFDEKTGDLDEHKVVLGVDSEAEALAVYDGGFSDGRGPERRRNMGTTEMSVDEFKTWLKDGDQKSPAAAEESAAPPQEDKAEEVLTAPVESATIQEEPEAGESADGTEHDNPGSDQGSVALGEPEGESDPDGSSDRDPEGDRGSRDGDEDAAPARDDVGTGVVGDRAGSSGDTSAERQGVNPGNFVITPDFPLGEGTPGQKIDANLAAIRLVKSLDAENRYATPEEQAILARYVGWGGLKRVFDPRETGKSSQFGRAQAELRQILTPQEYRAAAASTANAHYTSRAVVNAMWDKMRAFGFDGGRALEPTIGTGNFVGLTPAALAGKTDWFSAELDAVTGRIAAHLYPEATVFDGRGFEDAPFRSGSFDIAIGNPPFGSDIIGSDQHPEIPRMSVHNYIIAKTGLLLRPGGIMGMVVTNRFLDTVNPQARSYLARHFNFLGAVRMPNTAFAANAGTEVTTDIVWFQKRHEGDPAGDLSWLETDVAHGDVAVNGYFAANPDMMLGRPGMDGSMYGGKREFTLHDDGRNLASALAEAMAKIEGRFPTREEALADAVVAQKATSDLAIGESVLLDDGRVMVRRDDDTHGGAVVERVTPRSLWGDKAEEYGSVLDAADALADLKDDTSKDDRDAAFERLNEAINQADAFRADGGEKSSPTQVEKAIYALASGVKGKDPYFGPEQKTALAELHKALERRKLGSKGFEALKGILSLRKNAQALLRAENDNASNMEDLRKALRQEYRAFLKAHGYLSSAANDRLIGGVPGIEAGLEVGYKPADKARGTKEAAKEGAILRQRIIRPRQETYRADTPADGIHVSLRERGRLDLPFIANLTGQEVSEVVDALTGGENPQIFFDPKRGEYVIADEYLSGNLAEKIEEARRDGRHENIRHLEAAMPAPKTQDQVTPSIRSMWMPKSVFTDFLTEIGAPKAHVSINRKAGTIDVDPGSTALMTDFGKQFATERRNAFEVFSAAVRGKSIIVYDQIERGKQEKNEQETQFANAAMERMAAEFEKWVYLNPERAGAVVDAFNTTMNVVVRRKFDGVKYLTQIGNNPEIKLRNSQKNGAWRMMLSPSTLLHHVVGAGKTFTAVTAIMESKRLGLRRKTVVAVPNHLVSQWARDFYALYPGANILAASEKDFSKKNRRKLFARMATGDYDAIIVGHTALKFLENSAEDTRNLMEEQISDLQEALDEAKRDGTSRRTVSQIQGRIRNYEENLKHIAEKIESDGMGFDFTQIGIDSLVIDEAQEFKNLEYSTSADRLVGMNSPEGSQRAFDLYIKTRGLMARDGAVSFLTGTPVSNSLVEVYTVMKYLAPQTLRDMGLMHYDSWASTFVKSKTRFEYTAAQKLKERNVLAGLVNLGPLSEIYRSFSDIVMRPDVEAMYREQMEEENRRNGTDLSTRFPTPKVKDGGRSLVTIPASPEHEEFTDYLVMRMDGIKRNSRKKEYASVDNALWVLSDARKASIDIRTVDPEAQRSGLSKVVRSGDEIARIYRKWDDLRGTQLVFADSSVPNKTAEAGIARALKGAWEKAGLKKAEVKARMEADQRAGKSWGRQWGEAVEMIEDRLSDINLTAQQQEGIEAWIGGEDAADGAAAAFTADSGFSFYDDLRAYLSEKGIPSSEIAFIHDYDTAAKKSQLFDAVNDGDVRVLIGSTFKMGAGTNAQKRLVALHHIDAPWRPSDMEQREGRIIRQGNALYEADPDGFEVEITAYATEKTSDVVLWQVLERKAAGIEQFLNATADTLIDEDNSDADSYAEFMAQSTGNPVFLRKMETEKAVRSMEAALSSQQMILGEAKNFIATFDARLRDLQGTLDAARGVSFDGFDDAGANWSRFQKDTAIYEDARNAHQLAEAEVRKRNAALPEGEKRERLPKFEMTPPVIFQFKAKLDPWSDAVRQALFKAMEEGESDPLKVGAGEVIITAEKGKLDGDPMRFESYLRLDGRNYDLTNGTVYSKNPENSRALIGSMMPAAVQERADRIARFRVNEIERLRAAEPAMREKAEQGIDRSGLTRKKRELEMLTGRTRVAEVEAAKARVGKINRFAIMDTKGRDLKTDDGDDAPLLPGAEGQFTFHNSGMTYRADLGAKTAETHVAEDGKRHPVYWFEASADDGSIVMVKAAAVSGASIEVLDIYDTGEVVGGEKESRFTGRAPVASLTGTELGEWSDIRQLGKKAEAWYRNNLVGQEVTNTDTGMKIMFNAVGARKTGGRKGEDLYRIVPALQEILTSGALIETLPDRKGRDEIRAVHKFAARVMLDGASKEVVATVREKTDGTYHYDLSMDRGAGGFATSTVQDGKPSRTSALEGGPAELNLSLLPDDFNGPDAMERDRIAAAAEAELRKIGIAPDVDVRISAGGKRGVAGFYRSGLISIMVDQAMNWRETLDHEVIHALRDPALWGRDYGLFSQDEWRALVKAARADKGIAARVEAAYPDYDGTARIEEMVAELYADWARGQRGASDGVLASAFERIRSFFRALASALRGEGFVDAARVMEKIAKGEVGGRGPGGGQKTSGDRKESRFTDAVQSLDLKPQAEGERGLIARKITDAMGGNINLLALVPGRPLFAELGKSIPSARKYLRMKEEMDAVRNDWHAKMDETAQGWRKALSKDGDGNRKMMDLMHEATIAGVDPSRPFQRLVSEHDEMLISNGRLSKENRQRIEGLKLRDQARQRDHARLEEQFAVLPADFQKMFRDVRDRYEEMGEAFEEAVIQNVRDAMTIGLERAERRHGDDMRQIDDDGLTGEERIEAMTAAKKRLNAAKRMHGWGQNARVSSLRAEFETQKVERPYFPLARFGRYFVTLRDEAGKVISFSKFETEGDQQKFVRQARQDFPDATAEAGVINDSFEARAQVDPTFVAEVEKIVGEAGADRNVMDAIWQQYIDTLPDLSVRRSRLHRKGTPGYSSDAFRAFGRQMFHGAHQLARLKYALKMQKALEDAEAEAAKSTDPNRNGLLVTEMTKRHAFTMNPTGSAISQRATSAAFVYYLGVTPAAAMVNLSQTTVVGIPMLASAFKKGGVVRAARELGRALKDFTAGKASLEAAPNLTEDERAAMAEAYRRGTIDKSQAHDLAGVGETGVEYSDLRAKWMGRISYLFHHTERMNREVTFLAAYRMARDNDMPHMEAIEQAADLTWKTHFDYSNTSRPRLMQNDWMKVLLVFRNFQINMIYRLIRDAHEALKGETPEARREARAQLFGITMSMMLHAGIKGTWGYALIMMLMAAVSGMDEDDLEREMKDALVDSFGRDIAGIMLQGAPGHLAGVNLTSRMGMPELWFRSSDRILEGEDVYNHYLTEMVGAVPAMAENMVRGSFQIADGNVWRGVETMMPKFARDAMKSYRYASDGVTTMKGDPIFDDTAIADSVKQALGFTPARVAERYETNSQMKNKETRILEERRDILRRASAGVRAGRGVDTETQQWIVRFNAENPEYPITGDTIRRSLQSRTRAANETEGGIRLSQRLDATIRGDAAPNIYR